MAGPRKWLCLGLLVAGVPAQATTWIEQAQSELTCVGHASDDERRSLGAPWLPVPLDARSANAYFRGPARSPEHAQFRHLTLLAALGWWADHVNDQSLREETYVLVAAIADHHSARSGSLLLRQVARCARAHLIGTQIELDRPEMAERVAQDLLRRYPDDDTAVQPVEDWPLLIAANTLRLEPRARAANAAVSTQATRLATAASRARQAERASRLLSVTAAGMLALGDPRKARELALQSLAVTGRPPEAAAAWRAMPVLYDASLALGAGTDAANLHSLLQPDRPPDTLRDPQVRFESQLRLARAAEAQERFDDMARLQQDALRTLADLRGLDRPSMPFYRHALDELAGARDADLGTLARRDPAFATRTLATYTGLYDPLLRQAQSQFVADAREQSFFQYKIDNVLHALAELQGAMPRSGADIVDTSFRLAQLRSFGRLTLATLSAELARTPLDPQARFGVERFFSLSTQTAVWLRALLGDLARPPAAPPPDGEALWKAFFTLDVFYNETAKEFDKYTSFVRQKAPTVAALATPRPLPVQEFQRRLRTGEALVATLVTPRDLYVWAITSSQVVLVRQRITERELREKVRRLRTGLVPLGNDGTLPPFDAAAAHEIYRLVFGPFPKVLQGITDVVWYGHGPLGAVPPAVLVAAPPAKPSLKSPAEFAATQFLVDRHAFSALADLSLFPWHRDRPPPSRGAEDRRLLGVGAPMLTAEEVAGGPRSRSYELAGGMDGKALAELPKLAESVDEMKGLAAVVGESRATLWLGPDAREKHFVGDALRRYPLIALATHGFLPGEVQGVPEPALMLALEPESKDRFDGILTSREIAQLQLDADLVILSACNTASADGRPRAETFTGLTQAFFTAGARTLMASHWPVMSGAAVQLSVDTLQRATTERLAWSQSLQRAMQAARKAGAASPIESHPSYWGPFVIVGDGRGSSP